MVKVWHPDRFQSDARLRDKAQRTLQQINAAYTLLEHGATASRTEPNGNTGPAPAPTGDAPWLQLHPHTVTAVCAGLALGVALALALIFFRSTPAPAADLATESSASSVALPTEAPSQPASPAASPRPRPTTEPARPDSGTDLGRRGPVGRGTLSIRSGLALDGVVELRHDTGHTRRLYLRRGEKVTLLDLVTRVVPGAGGARDQLERAVVRPHLRHVGTRPAGHRGAERTRRIIRSTHAVAR